MLAYNFWRDVPDIIYDGIVDSEILINNVVPDNKKICIQNNTSASFLNLDADNNFENMSTDINLHDCAHMSLKEVKYPF